MMEGGSGFGLPPVQAGPLLYFSVVSQREKQRLFKFPLKVENPFQGLTPCFASSSATWGSRATAAAMSASP